MNMFTSDLYYNTLWKARNTFFSYIINDITRKKPSST